MFKLIKNDLLQIDMIDKVKLNKKGQGNGPLEITIKLNRKDLKYDQEEIEFLNS